MSSLNKITFLTKPALWWKMSKYKPFKLCYIFSTFLLQVIYIFVSPLSHKYLIILSIFRVSGRLQLFVDGLNVKSLSVSGNHFFFLKGKLIYSWYIIWPSDKTLNIFPWRNLLRKMNSVFCPHWAPLTFGLMPGLNYDYKIIISLWLE